MCIRDSGDPEIYLSASATLEWSNKPDLELVDFTPLMCGVNSQELKMNFEEDVVSEVVALHPACSVENEFSTQPKLILPPGGFGDYRFEILTTNIRCLLYTSKSE